MTSFSRSLQTILRINLDGTHSEWHSEWHAEAALGRVGGINESDALSLVY